MKKFLITAFILSTFCFRASYVEASSQPSMKTMNYQSRGYNRVRQQKRDAMGKLGRGDLVIGSVNLNSRKSKGEVDRTSLVKAITDELFKYPIASSDSNAGVFVTDWISIDSYTRQKIAISLTKTSTNLFAVRVHRQKKESSGDWVAVADDSTLADTMYRSILERANKNKGK